MTISRIRPDWLQLELQLSRTIMHIKRLLLSSLTQIDLLLSLLLAAIRLQFINSLYARESADQPGVAGIMSLMNIREFIHF